MHTLTKTLEEGLEDWRRFFLPSRRTLLEREFTKQKLTLPPPELLKIMLETDYPDWEKLVKIFAVFWGAVPAPYGPFFMKAYHRIPNVRQTLNTMLSMLQEDMRPDEFHSPLVRKLYDNAKKLSEARGHDTIMHPWEFAGPVEQLIRGFLKETPFYRLFDHYVNYEFPISDRKVHTTATASSQAGKTYLMKTQVLADATGDSPMPCIVLDPKDDVWAPDRGKGALWELLARERRLTNKVLITADDFPGINPFDRKGENFNLLYESFEYFMRGLMGSEMTPPMETMLKHILALCLAIPDATLDTMRDILTDFKPFRAYLLKLKDVDCQYFETEFVDQKGKINLTRDAVRHRINGMRAGALGDMFRAQRNMVDMRRWIDERKTIIIHASPNKLGKDFKVFGRYFIAEAIRAARSRRTTHQCMLFVDEASNFFDEKTELILEYMATSNFAGFFAFQQWDQARRARVDSAMGNARVKIFGGYDDDDLSYFRSIFEPEGRGRLDTLPPGNFYGRIAGKPAFTFQVPKLENDFMSEDEYQAFRQKNRELLTSPPRVTPSKELVTKQPLNDDLPDE